MRMLFEVNDLAVASPATVSRCGMVYLTQEELGWKPYVRTWVAKTFPDESVLSAEMKEFMLETFNGTIDIGIDKIRSHLCQEPIKTDNL